MDIEAVLLTGGESRRMGEDKAKLEIDGVPLALRISSALASAGLSVTVLGREPIADHGFLADEDEFAGPLEALARFRPTKDFVFVCSCDLPRFDRRLVELLRERIGNVHAATPFVDGFRQPLCALYRASAWASIPAILPQQGACPMLWLKQMEHVQVDESALEAGGIDPACTRGANTPEELKSLLG